MKSNQLYILAILAGYLLTACSKGNFASPGVKNRESTDNAVNSKNTDGVIKPMGPTSDVPDALAVRLFASADTSSTGQDSCAKPPTVFSFVSTRISPFDYCVSGASKRSPSLKFCLDANSEKLSRELDALCWVSAKDLERTVILNSGQNLVRLHVKDDAGNFASDDSIVTLDPGIAPQINIINPDAKKFSVGLPKSVIHDLLVEITDNDTPADKLKVVIQLSHPSGVGATKNLACNFSNSKRWSQCPAGAQQSSSLFKLDASKNLFTYQLTIPTDFDTSSPFVVLVTAIDQSGNAALASSSEVGSGFEVLAGRTYKGSGGAGSTIQRVGGGGYTKIMSDRNGTVYDLTLKQRVNPFDSRMCRFIRSSSATASAADCPDIIIHDFVPEAHGWAYNQDDDVFYASGVLNGARTLAQLDFRNKSVKALSSYDGKHTKSSATIPQGEVVQLSDLQLAGLQADLTFNTYTGDLYFRSDNYIFVRSMDGKTRKIIGNGTVSAELDDQFAKPGSLILPQAEGWFYPMLILKDGRLLMTGKKRAASTEGSGIGRLFVIEGLDLNNLNKQVHLINLDITDPVPSDRQLYTSLRYIPNKNKVYGVTAWVGVEELEIPKSMSESGNNVRAQAAAYVRKEGFVKLGAIDTTVNDFLVKEKSRTALPEVRQVPMYILDMVFAGQDYAYFNEYVSGYILGIDLKSRRIESVIGHVEHESKTEFSINRRVDLPKTIDLNSKGEVIFNDMKGIHRVHSDSPTSPFVVSKLISYITDPAPFVIDRVTDTLYQMNGDYTISKFMLNGSPIAEEKFSFVGGHTIPGYRIQSVLHLNSSGALKAAQWRSNWDGFRVKESYWEHVDLNPISSWTSGASIGQSILLSHSDLLSSDYPGCSACATPTPLTSNTISADKLRLSAIANGVRGPFASPVYLNDQEVLTCALHPEFRGGRASLAKINTQSKLWTFLNPTSASGSELACDVYHSQFAKLGNKIYHGFGTNVIEMDQSNLNSYVPLALKANVPSDAFINAILVTQDHLIFSDINTHRVIRIERSK
jgi:hypothetical protein